MKQMAELLRSGATMLSHSCPECASPLFRLKTGEIWCARCQRKVVIVAEGEEAMVESGAQLASVEKALIDKLVTLGGRLSQEESPSEIGETARVMDSVLAALERLRKIRKS